MNWACIIPPLSRLRMHFMSGASNRKMASGQPGCILQVCWGAVAAQENPKGIQQRPLTLRPGDHVCRPHLLVPVTHHTDLGCHLLLGEDRCEVCTESQETATLSHCTALLADSDLCGSGRYEVIWRLARYRHIFRVEG